jgi:hypothetical protein
MPPTKNCWKTELGSGPATWKSGPCQRESIVKKSVKI